MRLLVADNYPCNKCEVKYCRQNCSKFNLWLDTIVEAEPVVHGEWIDEIEPKAVTASGREVHVFKCSACGFTWANKTAVLHYFKHCPNCGAKMDGGEKDG